MNSAPLASVVIPAHNEARVITACLESLLAGAAPGELEVIVACNGCTDDTFQLAGTVSDEVIVVETDEASKWGALNLGDRTATVFPRMYLDADVLMSRRAVQGLAHLMNETGAMAGAPTLRLPLDGQSWAVRSFYETYQHSGYFESPFVGLGFYAISEIGRQRFGEFPASGSDDLLIMQTFTPDERIVDPECWFEPALPKSFRDLYKIRVRQLTSNNLRQDVAAGSGLSTANQGTDPRWVVRRLAHPKTALPTALYVVMKPITEAHAWWKSRGNREFEWARDSSSH